MNPTTQYSDIGDVVLNQLYLFPSIPNAPEIIDLKEFFIELNIYESIFSSFITGDLVISDSLNLVSKLPLVGEELITVSFNIPSFPENYSITRTFKINGIKERFKLPNGNTSVYKLTFSSLEMYKDILTTLRTSFAGDAAALVNKIFYDNLSSSLGFTGSFKQIYENGKLKDQLTYLEDKNKSELVILNTPKNVLKFISNNWTPSECIKWICSKSLADTTDFANSFLFWETTKNFYFGTLARIYNDPRKFSIGKYYEVDSSQFDSRDTSRKFFTVKDSKTISIFDQLENNLTGYLASRVVDIDLFNKNYSYRDYDHISGFFEAPHSFGKDSLPAFHPSTARNPSRHMKLNYSTPNLFTSIPGNFSEIYKDVFGNRRSNILELDQNKIELSIPGRPDIECGSIIELEYLENRVAGSATEKVTDRLYSGYYAITSLRHRISSGQYMCHLQVSKDCLTARGAVNND